MQTTTSPTTSIMTICWDMCEQLTNTTTMSAQKKTFSHSIVKCATRLLDLS